MFLVWLSVKRLFRFFQVGLYEVLIDGMVLSTVDGGQHTSNLKNERVVLTWKRSGVLHCTLQLSGLLSASNYHLTSEILNFLFLLTLVSFTFLFSHLIF